MKNSVQILVRTLKDTRGLEKKMSRQYKEIRNIKYIAAESCLLFSIVLGP